MSGSVGGRVLVLCDPNEPFRASTPAAAEAALRHRHFWSSRGRSPTVLVDLLAKPQGSPTTSRDRENSNTQRSHKVLEYRLGLSVMPTSHGSRSIWGVVAHLRLLEPPRDLESDEHHNSPLVAEHLPDMDALVIEVFLIDG